MKLAVLISATLSASLPVRGEQSSGTAEFQKKVDLALQDWALHGSQLFADIAAMREEAIPPALAWLDQQRDQ